MHEDHIFGCVSLVIFIVLNLLFISCLTNTFNYRAALNVCNERVDAYVVDQKRDLTLGWTDKTGLDREYVIIGDCDQSFRKDTLPRRFSDETCYKEGEEGKLRLLDAERYDTYDNNGELHTVFQSSATRGKVTSARSIQKFKMNAIDSGVLLFLSICVIIRLVLVSE
jgi:hypothetical protein